MRDNLLLEAEKTFKISKPAFFLLFTALLLSGILAVATVNNIDRGLQLMKLSFLRQGTTMIQSFEAGARTSMLFQRSMGHNPLVDLAIEILKDKGVAYIRIIDEKDTILVSEGTIPQALAKTSADIKSGIVEPVSTISWSDGIFEVTKQFIPVQTSPTGMTMMEKRWEQWHQAYKPEGRMFISVGFFTSEFEAARKGDMYHTLFMLTMLILLFFAGLYFLYLYQKMRVTHATLLNTRLYADNVLKSIPDGLITLDPDNKIVSCNENAEKLLGKPMEDIAGQPVFNIFPACPPELLKGQTNSLEQNAECAHASGEIVPVKVGSARLLNHLDQSIGHILVLRDIREIRKIEIQLERSRRLAALGGMAAGIAHEVRNPLGTLRGFAQFFGSEEGASDACKKYAHFMISEVDRLNQLVSALMQFGAPRELIFEKVDVDVLSEKITTLLEKDFSEKEISYSCRKDQGVILYGDADQLIQVIINLLKNGIRATPAGGEITLEFLQSEACCRICVSDSGKGMSEKTQSRMFDPFYTDSKDGTGLGLAVCHQIVEQHHGHFEVTSRIGGGTSVAIILPREKNCYA
ncbi:MAG: PAS domain-containing protein [Proteobacteria bacterium]|nr:PAS domain-containing protein [Pseudomonadota bacterium]